MAVDGAIRRGAGRSRGADLVLVAGGFALALGVRLAGIRGSLPYPLNVDEIRNYVWPEAGLWERGLDPILLYNPTGYTYASWLLTTAVSGSPGAAEEVFRHGAGDLILNARIVSAITGAAMVPGIWLSTRLMYGRLAAAISIPLTAVAFLPVVYAHMSLNDAMATSAGSFALAATVMAFRSGSRGWFVAAGLLCGVATGTKWNEAVLLAGLLAAAWFACRERGTRVLAGTALPALAAAVGGVLLTTPFAVLDPERFIRQTESLARWSSQGWVGGIHDSTLAFYPWSFTWGLGWVPLMFALAGIVFGLARHRRVTVIALLPAILIAISCLVAATMFGRYALPAYPALIAFAAVGAASAARCLTRRRRQLLVPVAALAAIAIAAEGAIHSAHFDRVWSRPGTASLTAEWVLRNVPAGSGLVVDRYLPPWWPTGSIDSRYRIWPEAKTLANRIRWGGLYVGSASPAVLDEARRNGYCWVVTSSFQAGRAFNSPARLKSALAYYRELEGPQAQLMFRASPFTPGAGSGGPPQVGPQPYDFDMSYNSWGFSYERPGPLLSVYRLRNCNQQLMPAPAAVELRQAPAQLARPGP